MNNIREFKHTLFYDGNGNYNYLYMAFQHSQHHPTIDAAPILCLLFHGGTKTFDEQNYL